MNAIPLTSNRPTDVSTKVEAATSMTSAVQQTDIAQLAASITTAVGSVRDGGGGGGTTVGLVVAVILAFGVWVFSEVEQAKIAASEAKSATVDAHAVAASLEKEIDTIKRDVERVDERGERTIADLRRNTELLEFLAEHLFPNTPIPRASTRTP